MRNHKKESQGIRKRQKTYSKYFMWQTIGIVLIFMLSALIGSFVVKVKIEITEIHNLINNQGYRIDAIERIK